METLTASRLRTVHDCARKEKLMYQDRWRPAKDTEQLRFGKMIHAGLEAWWNAVKDGLPNRLELALAQTEGAADPFEQIRAQELLRAYEEKWAADIELYEVLAVEAEFECALLNPATMAASRTFRLGGRIDLIVRLRSDQRILVWEIKTTSETIESDADEYWLRLAMNAQLSLYFIGAEALGFPPDEAHYDVLKKPGQRPLLATPEASRKYTKTGELYANQRDRDETPDEYRARVRAAVADGTCLKRKAVPRLNSEIRDFLADAWIVAGTIRESKNIGSPGARNPDACFKFGSRCAFFEVCCFGMKPDEHPEMYRRIEVQHEELNVRVDAA